MQRKNSLEVITCFDKLTNENNLHFLKFDICSFYPSIERDELNKGLSFIKNVSKISLEDESIIFHYFTSIRSDLKVNIWTNADNNLFDVAMGSYMGAEICDLIGIFLVNDLRKLSKSESIGLYRDDGLMVTTRSKFDQ